MRVGNNFMRSTLSVQQTKVIIDQAAARGVAALSITGGEPLLFPRDIASLIHRAGKAGIRYTRTGTNGFIFRNPDSADFSDRVQRLANLLAETPLRNFWISIDSADPATHERMRGFTGIIRGIEKALPVFHKCGLFPTANLGLNRNLGGAADNSFTRGGILAGQGEVDQYKEHICSGLRQFFTLVMNLGFTLVNFCYPMSIAPSESGLSAVYPANSEDHIVRFSDREKSLMFSAMLETLPDWRQKIRIFSPLSALYTLQQVYGGASVRPFPCRGGLDHFFINAGNGMTYPCGFRGDENLGDYRTTSPEVRDRTPCNRCDWECFRDPSELMGPLVQGVRNPFSLLGRYRRDREFYRLWRQDISYYRTCGMFDGRADTRPSVLRDQAATGIPGLPAKAYSPENTGCSPS